MNTFLRFLHFTTWNTFRHFYNVSYICSFSGRIVPFFPQLHHSISFSSCSVISGICKLALPFSTSDQSITGFEDGDSKSDSHSSTSTFLHDERLCWRFRKACFWQLNIYLVSNYITWEFGSFLCTNINKVGWSPAALTSAWLVSVVSGISRLMWSLAIGAVPSFFFFSRAGPYRQMSLPMCWTIMVNRFRPYVPQNRRAVCAPPLLCVPSWRGIVSASMFFIFFMVAWHFLVTHHSILQIFDRHRLHWDQKDLVIGSIVHNAYLDIL